MGPRRPRIESQTLMDCGCVTVEPAGETQCLRLGRTRVCPMMERKNPRRHSQQPRNTKEIIQPSFLSSSPSFGAVARAGSRSARCSGSRARRPRPTAASMSPWPPAIVCGRRVTVAPLLEKAAVSWSTPPDAPRRGQITEPGKSAFLPYRRCLEKRNVF